MALLSVITFWIVVILILFSAGMSMTIVPVHSPVSKRRRVLGYSMITVSVTGYVMIAAWVVRTSMRIP